MGYVPPPPPLTTLATIYGVGSHFLGSAGGFRPSLDRFGMPRDYETYLWATYGEGRSLSPDRRAFLYGGGWEHPNLGQQVIMR